MPTTHAPTHNNRDKNAFKTINAPAGSAMAKAAAASNEGGNTADVFSRRHTQSKVYWATGRSNAAAAAAEKQAQQQQQQQQQLQRTASGATDVESLKGSLKKLDPAELIKVRNTRLWSKRHLCVFGIVCDFVPFT